MNETLELKLSDLWFLHVGEVNFKLQSRKNFLENVLYITETDKINTTDI